MMFDNIKIVFIDIDNTLTTQKKKFKVSIENKIAIKEIQRKKIHIVLASGRSRQDVKKIWNQIHLNNYSDFIIYANGAGVENITEENHIFLNPIGEEDYHKLIDFAYENKNYFVLSGNRNIWGDHHPDLIENFLFKLFKNTYKKYDKNFEVQYTTDKFGIIIPWSKKKVNETIMKFKEKFSHLEIITSTKGKYIEITNKNVNKAEGAKILLDHLKISEKNAMAIGDSMNDFKLFEFVGTSVIVKNGNKELKKIANYETQSAKRNGVKRILDGID